MSDGLGFRITTEGCAWVCDGCGKEFPSGGTLHLCDAKLPEEYARLRANIATLEADLAASREREAALAAALKVAEKTIGEAMQAASAMNLNKAGFFLSAYVLCGKDYEAILARYAALAGEAE